MQIGCENSTISGKKTSCANNILKKTGCANNTMSGLMSKQADGKKQEGEYLGFYDVSTKSLLLT